MDQRNFLSIIVDPLGLLADKSKVLMQEVWIHGLDWDKFPGVYK